MVHGEREGGIKYTHTVWEDASAVISTAERTQSVKGEERQICVSAFIDWMKWEYERLFKEVDANEGFVEVDTSNGCLMKKDLNPNTILKVNYNLYNKVIHRMTIEQVVDGKINTLLFDVRWDKSYRPVRNQFRAIYATSEGPSVVSGVSWYRGRSLRLSTERDDSVRLEVKENKMKITKHSLASNESLP